MSIKTRKTEVRTNRRGGERRLTADERRLVLDHVPLAIKSANNAALSRVEGRYYDRDDYIIVAVVALIETALDWRAEQGRYPGMTFGYYATIRVRRAIRRFRMEHGRAVVISPNTVSHALRGTGGIAAGTRDRITDACRSFSLTEAVGDGVRQRRGRRGRPLSRPGRADGIPEDVYFRAVEHVRAVLADVIATMRKPLNREVGRALLDGRLCTMPAYATPARQIGDRFGYGRKQVERVQTNILRRAERILMRQVDDGELAFLSAGVRAASATRPASADTGRAAAETPKTTPPRPVFRREAVADLMVKHGLEVEGLAQRVHTTPPAVRRWLAGVVTPTMGVVCRMAVAFGVPVDFFVEIRGEGAGRAVTETKGAA
ncbi:MAG: helix-turn-helix domain-containing protein [Phycisphaerae bacterium]|nr:helix-turn-helix domain-containing protein [Phycisphaerae bacterium]